MTRTIVFSWIGLLVLLGLQVIATLTHAGWIAALLAPVMIGTVAVAFMQILQETALSRIFAIAGLFWVAVLIGLGGIDFLVRHDVGTPVHATPTMPG